MDSLPFFFATLIGTLIAAVANPGHLLAQGHRVSVRDVERGFDELVQLNQRLTVTLEQREKTIKDLAARVEALERVCKRDARTRVAGSATSQDWGPSERNHKTVPTNDWVMENLRSRLEETERRLHRLEHERDTQPIVHIPAGTQLGVDWTEPPIHQYPGLYEYRSRPKTYGNW
jgi:hypothetical protein